MSRIVLAFLLASLSAGSALAGEAQTPLSMAQRIFEAADSNADGALTAEEHGNAGLGRFGASFDDFDLDGDSRVTWSEYKALFERHHKPAGRAA